MNSKSNRWGQWGSTGVRVLIGILFIYMGLSKALDPVAFLKLIRQYHLPIAYWMLNVIGASLPWFEMFCGFLLLLGVAVRGTALILITMLVPFTIAVALRGLEIAEAQHLAFCAVKFDCGCGAGEVYVCAKIVENVLLTLASIWLLTGSGRKLSLRYGLIKGAAPVSRT